MFSWNIPLAEGLLPPSGIMNFPAFVSFTLTNACNLRCTMCGQWSPEGYVRTGHGYRGPALDLAVWKRLADEVAANGVSSILLRGGEPFLHPDIVPLLEHLHGLGLYVSIDSNGTRLAGFAEDLVRLGQIHVTVSVDGPATVHDEVRGMRGCFALIQEGLSRLAALDGATPRRVSRAICFTISPWSVRGLGEMPYVARQLGVDTICIVPYCYVSAAGGELWRQQVRELVGGEPFSWRGFQHEESGVDPAEFAAQYQRFTAALNGLNNYPYLPLTADEYRVWFAEPTASVGPPACSNVERLIDIQPTGEANFCVDLPDGPLGHVRQSSIAAIWNGDRARRFREARRHHPFGACARCVARHMADVRS
jgi:MoaA/NifB/PqqE/SkfB family radical SAM enzyme